MDTASNASENSEKKLLSIVLPVYNEETILPLLTAKLAKALWPSEFDYEMIFVNDGSRDSSGGLLEEMASTTKKIRIVHLSRNFGQQAAIQAGLAHARGDAIVLMDADLQDAPDAILQLAAKWQAGYDMVYAICTDRRQSGMKRFISNALKWLVGTTGTVPFATDSGNFSLIDRRVAKWLLTLGEHDRYLPGLRAWMGFKQIGVEIERDARYDVPSRLSLATKIERTKTAIFSFTSLPLAFFKIVAVTSIALFTGIIGFSVFSKLFAMWSMPTWTIPLLAGSFFAGLNSLGVCVLGEYLVRVFDQVRNRPLYLVDRTVNVDSSTTGEKNKNAGKKPLVALDEDFSGDEKYLQLMDDAMSLLQTGSNAREAAVPSNEAPVASNRSYQENLEIK
jgi:dolichol-phosphate mannosyltransferase